MNWDFSRDHIRRRWSAEMVKRRECFEDATVDRTMWAGYDGLWPDQVGIHVFRVFRKVASPVNLKTAYSESMVCLAGMLTRWCILM